MSQGNVFSLKPHPRLEPACQTMHRQIQITDHVASRLPHLSDLATPHEVNGRDNLITDTHKKHKRRDSFFGQRRRALELQRMRSMRGMPGGYENFPGPDKLVG